MNKQIYPLLVAQFLSAFADNAILFTVIAMVMQSNELAQWYVPALQSVFFIAFVVLAPWVGAFADNYAKSRILIIANLIKAVGALLLVLGVEPLIAYCIVGVGAALYSPAKYGILPEIAGHKTLVKANSWIEGSTIFAIIFGMVIGAKVADYSIEWALLGTLGLFLISAVISVLLPAKITCPKNSGFKVIQFGQQIGTFFETTRSRFSVLSASLFWASAASVRVIIIAWAPLVLMTQTATEIAELTFFLAIGIIVGSGIVPRLIPLEHLQRVRIPAYFMSFFIIILSFMETILNASILLFLIGTMGGLFIVPINAALQEIGQKSIGSGGAVALQNFFQNVAMLLAVGTYTYSVSLGVSPVSAMLTLGILVFSATFIISLRLPKNQPEA
ncbi:MAG: lysophospholipid transporter LplT [Methylococcales bacterium]|nr:lysophospholipid transporter LplT [Methylococcales bacterium]MCK5925649.1 lysophospholipid transporter LplT [Methylococcales bacterium]